MQNQQEQNRSKSGRFSPVDKYQRAMPMDGVLVSSK